ncbi:unnamed protein product [Amoebophrya sp. A120]|nr:unnamed protein product [Amoebophrya sp. A120]|eukprot:GSA120T00013361001.1
MRAQLHYHFQVGATERRNIVIIYNFGRILILLLHSSLYKIKKIPAGINAKNDVHMSLSMWSSSARSISSTCDLLYLLLGLPFLIPRFALVQPIAAASVVFLGPAVVENALASAGLGTAVVGRGNIRRRPQEHPAPIPKSAGRRVASAAERSDSSDSGRGPQQPSSSSAGALSSSSTSDRETGRSEVGQHASETAATSRARQQPREQEAPEGELLVHLRHPQEQEQISHNVAVNVTQLGGVCLGCSTRVLIPVPTTNSDSAARATSGAGSSQAAASSAAAQVGARHEGDDRSGNRLSTPGPDSGRSSSVAHGAQVDNSPPYQYTNLILNDPPRARDPDRQLRIRICPPEQRGGDQRNSSTVVASTSSSSLPLNGFRSATSRAGATPPTSTRQNDQRPQINAVDRGQTTPQGPASTSRFQRGYFVTTASELLEFFGAAIGPGPVHEGAAFLRRASEVLDSGLDEEVQHQAGGVRRTTRAAAAAPLVRTPGVPRPATELTAPEQHAEQRSSSVEGGARRAALGTPPPVEVLADTRQAIAHQTRLHTISSSSGHAAPVTSRRYHVVRGTSTSTYYQRDEQDVADEEVERIRDTGQQQEGYCPHCRSRQRFITPPTASRADAEADDDPLSSSDSPYFYGDLELYEDWTTGPPVSVSI